MPYEKKVQLTSDLIDGFVQSFLLKNFDEPVKTPKFHKEMWDLCTSGRNKVAIAAPRSHAKSTAITLAYVLSAVCFRFRKHVLIVSDSEAQSVGFLGSIKTELTENEDIRSLFGIKKLKKDRETEIICQFDDGQEFRILARGSDQRLRGTKWGHLRPDLIVCDDMEDDEMVLSDERRNKFMNWFTKALLPCGSRNAIIIIVGTILHEDSLLANLVPKITDEDAEVDDLRITSNNPKRTWLGTLYEANNDDFSEILWPEAHSRESLMALKLAFEEMGKPEAYDQEYRNRPVSKENAFFKDAGFSTIQDFGEPVDIYIGVDLAISAKDRRAYTVFSVQGLSPNRKLKVIHQERFRGDALEIIDTFFMLHERWPEAVFVVESENIAKTIGPILQEEMGERDTFFHIEMITPSKDKEARARALQARHNAGYMEYNTEAEWYTDFYNELMLFPRSMYKDQVDAAGLPAQFLDRSPNVASMEEEEVFEYQEEYEDYLTGTYANRNRTTGY